MTRALAVIHNVAENPRPARYVKSRQRYSLVNREHCVSKVQRQARSWAASTHDVRGCALTLNMAQIA